ncbi:MAG: hypothetical protein ABI670_15745 [Chloroflexota bacterium]
MSIVLGLVIEGLLIASRLGAFATDSAMAELVNRVSWSFLVCTGLAIGDALTDEKPFWLGMAGLAGAPVAFTGARGLHKGTAELLAAPPPAEAISPLLVGAIRGVEYMVLGFALFWLSRRLRTSLFPYIGAGLLTGLAFGSVLLVLNPAITASATSMAVWVVNELIFPAGCSLVLFASKTLGNKLTKQAV